MKTLYLVRHAKSSWDNPFLEDYDRPLNKRGKKAAPIMGKRLKKLDVRPDLFISSPAKRAFATAKKVAKKLGIKKKEIQLEEEVYHGSRSTLLKVIKEQPNDTDSLMLFGHNPGFNDLANYFIPSFNSNIPTGGVLCIVFQTDYWYEVSPAIAEFNFFDFPKNKQKPVKA